MSIKESHEGDLRFYSTVEQISQTVVGAGVVDPARDTQRGREASTERDGVTLIFLCCFPSVRVQAMQ